MRILGLDLGIKTCGIALTDELQITAQPKENFRFEEKDFNSLLKHLKSYIDKGDIEKVVLGRPTLPSGDPSKTTLMIEDFAILFKEEFNIPIVFWDENGSTNKANEIMISAGLTRKKRKEHKDVLAAVVILQDYLQFNL